MSRCPAWHALRAGTASLASAALLPGFIADWHITTGEAGWITGLFYAAYTVSVPIFVTLTDRVDPRTVYLGGVALTIASHLGRCRGRRPRC